MLSNNTIDGVIMTPKGIRHNARHYSTQYCGVGRSIISLMIAIYIMPRPQRRAASADRCHMHAHDVNALISCIDAAAAVHAGGQVIQVN